MANNDSGDGKKSTFIICFGEMLIDFVPTVSGVSLAKAPAFKKAAGGAPANVAVGIARLGGSSAFIGKVGDDEFGHMLSNILKSNNVDNSGVRFDTGARTALAFVTLRGDGEREFMFYRNPSADMLLKKSELDLNLIKKGSIFHYGSISLIEEPCRSTHLAALQIAKNEGIILSYDPNLRLPLWPSADAAREGIKSIWKFADVIKKFHGRIAAFRVKVVDTTGAGDSFVSGLLIHLASNLDLYKNEKKLKEALLFASACGAITVTGRGAIPSLPTKEAVLDFLHKGDEQPQHLCVVS